MPRLLKATFDDFCQNFRGLEANLLLAYAHGRKGRGEAIDKRQITVTGD